MTDKFDIIETVSNTIIEPTKNILAGQEGLIRRPVFDGEFGKEQK